MVLRFDVLEEDYLEFNNDSYFSSKLHKKVNKYLKWILLPFFFLVAFAKAGFTLPIPLPSMIAVSILTVLWICFADKIFRFLDVGPVAFLNKKAVRLYLKSGKVNHFIGAQVLELAEDCIIEISELTESRLQYQAVERVVRGKNSFYIYVGVIQAIIVPFSAFENDEQQRQFFAILSNKTGLELTKGGIA